MKLNNLDPSGEGSSELLSRLADTIERLSYSLDNHERNAIQRSPLSSLTGSQIHCLDKARHLGEVRIGILAEALAVSMPTATVTVNLLEKKGYLKKVKHKDDGRVVVVTLTEKGMEISRLHDEIHCGYARMILNELEPEEASALNSLLVRAMDRIDALTKRKHSDAL